MRRDPVYLAFTITFPSEESVQSVIDVVRQRIAPDAELVDTRVSSEGTETVKCRISDFFEDIALLPDSEGKADRLRLVFHRHPNAGLFWKDIMVRIVRTLETEWNISATLDYQGDAALDWMRPLNVD